MLIVNCHFLLFFIMLLSIQVITQLEHYVNYHFQIQLHSK